MTHHGSLSQIENEMVEKITIYINGSFIVGPCSCVKTYLLINKVLLSEFKFPDRKMKILTKFPNQYREGDAEKKTSTFAEYTHKKCVLWFLRIP